LRSCDALGRSGAPYGSRNVHSADGWRAELGPVIACHRGTVKQLYFRGDVAFANPEMDEFIEAESVGDTIRLAGQ
jgi:hypothetical protein